MDDFIQGGGYETCTVAAGETLSQISKRFGVSGNWLKKINDMADDALQAGRALKIRRAGNQPSAMVYCGSADRNEIALTYDSGGPECGSTPELLDVLGRRNVKATFFFVGEWAEKYPELATAIAGAGHEIGNHSYSHPDFTQISAEEAERDIRRGEDAIRRVTGAETRPLLRYPYGYFNDPARTAAGRAGYSHSIQWSIDPRDWEGPSTAAIAEHVLGRAKAGDIVLLHSYMKNTPQATDIIIQALAEKGFRFVTVSEFITAYQPG